MGRMPDDTQLKRMLAELREALDQLEEGAVLDRYDDVGRKIGIRRTPNLGRLFILAAAARKDGWYTSSMGGGVPSSSSKGDTRQGLTSDGRWVDLDDWDSAEEPLDVRTEFVPTPPHGDRVGTIGADEVKVADPIRVHAERLLRALSHALHDMRIARGSMIAAFEDVKPEEGDPACTSHARIGVFVKADRGSRCDWCYRFSLAEQQTPPVEILRAKSEGKRITVQMVEEATGKKRAKRKVKA